MNNNKKILKRSVAAFLAALNIFNFAGGSSKAHYIDYTSYIDKKTVFCSNYSVINNDVIINNILQIAHLGIAWDDIKKMETNQETQAGLSFIQKTETIKFDNNNGIYICNLSSGNKDFKLVYFDFNYASICEENFKNILEKINEVYEDKKLQKIGFVVFNKPYLFPLPGSGGISSETFYDALSKNGNIFVNKDIFSNQNFCELIKEIKNLQEQLETAQDKVQKADAEKENAEEKLTQAQKDLEKEKEKVQKANEENEKLKKENDKIAIYVYMKKVLNGLVESLKELDNLKLEKTADNLEKVKKDISFGDAKFRLVGKDDNSFLGKFKFKYNEKEETFSINELIGKLEELGLIEERNKIEKLKSIKLDEIKIAKQQDNEQKEEEQEYVLNVEAYKGKLQRYIEALLGIIDAINSIPGNEALNNKIKELNGKIETFESNENTCKDKAKKVLDALNKAPELGDTLEQQLDGILAEVNDFKNAKETAEKDLETEKQNTIKAEQSKNDLDTKLKTANSRARKLGATAVLGWIGTLVSLGCILQNELKNACGTVYKKVLELKNSILG